MAHMMRRWPCLFTWNTSKKNREMVSVVKRALLVGQELKRKRRSGGYCEKSWEGKRSLRLRLI